MAQHRAAHTGRQVTEVILAGGSSQLPGLPLALQEAAGFPVSLGDPLKSLAVTLPNRISAANRDWLIASRVLFAPSLGLAARGASLDPVAAGVNLLPERVKRTYVLWRENLAISIFSVLTAAVLLVFVGLFGGRAIGLALRERGLAGRPEATDITMSFTAPVRDAIAAARDVNAEVTLLSDFERQRPAVLEAVRSVRSAFQGGIHVGAISVEPPAAQGTGLVVTVRGTFDTRAQFLAFEDQLKQLPGLTAVDSPLSNLDQPTAGTFVVHVTFGPRT